MTDSSPTNSPRTVVVTGASDGIGAVTARALAGPEVNLILVGRSPHKLAAVTADTGATGFTADFAELDQVRTLARQIADQVTSIDVLVNNAGGLFDSRPLTPDGHEPNFQINHLASFLLTNLLRDRLAAAKGALVLNTSSMGNLYGRIDMTDLDYKRRYPVEGRAYGTAKLMNILFTRGIAARWSGDEILSAAVHPGPVASNFGRNTRMMGLLTRTPLHGLATITPERGAEPLIALARRGADPEINGIYFHRHRARGPESPQAHDQRLIDELWSTSSELVGLG